MFESYHRTRILASAWVSIRRSSSRGGELRVVLGNTLLDLRIEIGQHPNAAEVAPHRLRSPLDISLARKELGWQPKVYLEEGIAKLAAWLEEHKAQLKI